ncbi:MAG: AbrB/MazE/SpoVT family DNA-binding domain-containing protein [Terriglobales bacterium]
MRSILEFATVGPNGEVGIPAPIRRKLGIKPGTSVLIREDQGKIIVVKPGTDAYIDALRGMLGDTTPLIEQLRRDQKTEDKRRERLWKRQGL